VLNITPHWIFRILIFVIISTNVSVAQEKGILTGDFTLNTAFYNEDSVVGTNTTQYFHQKSSSEAWTFLNYRYQGFTVNARFDLFNNSPLLIPQEAFTRQGLAFYNVSKTFNKVSITAGHFYDQFGSGSIFRAFEDRNIGLDYAIQGVKLVYSPNDSLLFKAFTGLQKQRFDQAPQVIKGANIEKIWGIGNLGFNTGIAYINRTLDQQNINILSEYVNALPFNIRADNIPKYNVYAGTLYNTLSYRNLSLNTEFAYKTKELNFIENTDGSTTLQNKDGNLFSTSLSYSGDGLGINLGYRRVDKFILRTSPYTNFLVGVINYLPPLSRQTSYRLPARYSIGALNQGEEAYQAEVIYSINKRNTFDVNYSHVNRLDGKLLYREFYIDYSRKFNKNLKGIIGVQKLTYNQDAYQGKPQVPNVKAFTPFTEWSVRLKSRNAPDSLKKFKLLRFSNASLRFEGQYLATRQDLGNFAWVLAELNLAPKYSISVSDMINVNPTKGDKVIHYYNFFVAYSVNQSRVSLTYARQVEGIVCTGGVCRVEPAFSGFRINLVTNF